MDAILKECVKEGVIFNKPAFNLRYGLFYMFTSNGEVYVSSGKRKEPWRLSKITILEFIERLEEGILTYDIPQEEKDKWNEYYDEKI